MAKYNTFVKSDGSIISKIKVGDHIVSDNLLANNHLAIELQILYGGNSSSFIKLETFPYLPSITIGELREIISSLSRKEATDNDLINDTSLLNDIITSDKFAEVCTHFWDTEIMNSTLMKRYLTGRLIQLNKIHPEIPEAHQMRSIIALSPILKIIENRFKHKLDSYINYRMVISQTGFVEGCGT